jgi:hypothetical protein
MRRRSGAASLIVMVSGALALVTGCGSSSASSSAASSGGTGLFAPSQAASAAPSSAAATQAALPDACSLLMQTEAEALAGTPLMAPVPAGPAGSGENTLCQFVGPTSGPTAQVEVFVGDGAKKQLDIDRDNLKHAFTTVPGIGDQCLQEDDFIFVEKHGVWASINLVLLNDAQQNVVPLQTAIKQVAARLP